MYLVKNYKSSFYQLVYFESGKRSTITTKTKNEKEAFRFLINFNKNNTGRKKDIQQITISRFLEEYLEFIQITNSKNYIRSVKTSYKNLIEFSGDIYLNQLDLRTLDKFITTTFKRTERGAALYYRTIKASFTKAVLWKYLSENPLKKIKLPKVSKAFPEFISENELRIIIENTSEEFLKDLFTVAFYTGMRLGELVNMKWSWVDLNENQIIVKCSDSFTTKSKRERVIPINQNLKSVLQKSIPKVFNIKTSYVFTNKKGSRLNENYVSKKFKAYVRAAGLNEKIHFHTLRHSFASLLVQKGVSLYVIKELLGHESLTTTQIYSHLQQQNLRDAVNLL